MVFLKKTEPPKLVSGLPTLYNFKLLGNVMQSNPLLPDTTQHSDDNSTVVLESPLVNTNAGVRAMLDMLDASPTAQPTIFIDLEGVNLGREGQLCLIAIHHTVSNRSFVVDVYSIGADVFVITASDGQTTLRSILESPYIPKGIFDVRNDSAALYHGFGVRVRCMHDIQLLEIVARPRTGTGSWKFRSGLGKAIRNHSDMSAAEMNSWSAIKTTGVRLFAPDKGGTYEVFKQRPLAQVLIPYSVNDVIHLPHLYRKFSSTLTEQLRRDVESEAERAIARTLSPLFNGKGSQMSFSPWS